MQLDQKAGHREVAAGIFVVLFLTSVGLAFYVILRVTNMVVN